MIARQTTKAPIDRPGALRSGPAIQEMFGRIARRYDVINRVMTGGRDVAWRRMAVGRALGDRDPARLRVLDVATGTGDLALALSAAGAGEVAGADFAPPMLHAAKEKDRSAARVAWIVADALALPFRDDHFDACSVAFGLRNMADYGAALREMTRVLSPGGRIVCLELTPLHAPVVATVFGWYFSNVVPVVGGLLSGDRDAYRYLPTSVAAFPSATALARLMDEAGLEDVTFRRLGGGAVALHVGTKPGKTTDTDAPAANLTMVSVAPKTH